MTANFIFFRGEKMELDDRKKKILQAIVEGYVRGAEPVSSNELTDELRL